MTQDALADGASMDPAEVRRIEAGHRDPGVRVLTRIAHGLDVTPAELLDGAGPPRRCHKQDGGPPRAAPAPSTPAADPQRAIPRDV